VTKYLIVLFALVLAGCSSETHQEKSAREAKLHRQTLCAMHSLTYLSEYHEKSIWPSRSHRVVYGSVCTNAQGQRIIIKDNGNQYGS
jgi:signal recognition particle GTPase